MSNLRNLAKQSSFYFISNTVIIMCSFISFPIWTRIFTMAEYGMFSLINITVMLGTGISKFGLQHAAMRYYSDFKENKIRLDISCYYTTLLLGSMLIMGASIYSSLLIVRIFFKSYLDAALMELLYLIAALILAQSINSVLIIFVRVEEKGLLYSIISIAEKYGRLLGALVMIAYVSKNNLRGFVAGWLFSEAVMTIVLLSRYVKKINFSHTSYSFLKEAIFYGFPLIWMELSNMLLNFGDRYLIQYYMGSEAVGVYSAGYNLAVMAQSLLAVPLKLAITPMYLNIWNRDGKEETKKFIDQIFNYYLMVGMPIIIGMSWFGKDIITVLATAKFKEAHVIIPYIILPLIFHGAYPMYAAGLFIAKKTKVLMYITVFSMFVNLLANILLIPYFGILGAAYATSIAYVAVIILLFATSNKYLKIKIEIVPALKYTALSFLIMLSISGFEATNIRKMLVKISMGVILYALGIISMDKTLRNALGKAIF